MRENLERALVEVFGHEGSMSLVRSDPGNWTSGKVGKGVLKGTKYGIAANSYPNLDIRNLTLAEAAAIYRQDYWHKAGCEHLFPGVDLAVLDLAINSGVGRVRQFLPKAVGSDDHAETVRRLCALRLKFMRGARGGQLWKTFGKGWSRRVARIEATGVAWALAAMGRSPVEVRQDLEREAAEAKRKAKEATAGGIATGGAAAGGTAVLDPSSFDWTAWLLVGGLVAGAAIVAVLLFLRAKRQRDRAKAYQAAVPPGGNDG